MPRAALPISVYCTGPPWHNGASNMNSIEVSQVSRREKDMSQVSSKKFSLGWIITSYFMIFGGIFLTMVLFGAAKLSGTWTQFAIFAVGSLIGGFFTGRASPHKSIVEPALGALAMVATLAAFFLVTPIGQFIFSMSKAALIRNVSVIGVLSFGGGIGGAILGEMLSSDEHGSGPFSWLVYSTLISMGAIIASFFILVILMMRGEVSSYGDLKGPILGALGISSIVGSAITQMSAPRRMVLISGVGFFAALLGMSLLAGVKSASGGVFAGLVIIGVGGSLLGIASSRVAWTFARHFKG